MRRVSILVPNLAGGGGVPSVARFVHRVLADSGEFTPAFISLATSRRDPFSVRLGSPRSWRSGVRSLESVWEGIPYTHVGAFLTELEFQRYRPRLVLTRLLERADLVQVVAGSPAVALAASTCSRPVVLQVATLAAEERRAAGVRGWRPRFAWRAAMTRVTNRFDHEALRRVDRVLVENTWMYARLTATLDSSRVIFAPPGVDTKLFRPRAATTPAEPYVLTVGRLSDGRKNVGLLLEAYARLRSVRAAVPRLVLVGDRAARPAMHRHAVRLGLRDRVVFHSDLTNEELAALYRHASVFALGSNEEGLALVLLEAMASGVPVVSTDCGGPRTAVVDGVTGFLTPTGDAAGLAARLGELLDDPQRRAAMGAAARARCERSFSIEAAGEPYLAVYRELLGRPEVRGGAAR